jgi:hypothetical protein
MDDICTGKEDGTLLPDPDNCQQFFVCYDEEAALASCLRRNCFNAKEGTCEPCPGCGYTVLSKGSLIKVCISLSYLVV